MTNNVDRWDDSIPEDILQTMARKAGVDPEVVRLCHRHELIVEIELLKARTSLTEAQTQSYASGCEPHPVLAQTIDALKALSPLRISQDMNDAIDEFWSES